MDPEAADGWLKEGVKSRQCDSDAIRQFGCALLCWMYAVSQNHDFYSNLITNLPQPPPSRVLMGSRGRRKRIFWYFRMLCGSQMSSLVSLSNVILFVLATKTEKVALKQGGMGHRPMRALSAPCPAARLTTHAERRRSATSLHPPANSPRESLWPSVSLCPGTAGNGLQNIPLVNDIIQLATLLGPGQALLLPLGPSPTLS